MAYQTLYPYQNRQLSMRDQKTPKEHQMCFIRLSCLLIANLVVGESVLAGEHSLTVTSINDDAVSFDDGTTIMAAELPEHFITQQLSQLLPTLAPAYISPLVFILERDPAVFRLRTQNGWVINDALCLMSGNIQYGKKELPNELVNTEVLAQEPIVEEQSGDAGTAQTIDDAPARMGKTSKNKIANEAQFSLF